ncbi:hypothetical protein C6N75_00755 [Streptomyces solincola]|uniref:DUF4190 domain-containing protein n=1 Tax=Streptomyces solincola TaxID=2100817 RepID=A0A2S9Q317_9ACTN|nr:DUF4190 domain-containing protein [Streptomyces solincola]PRH81061.1 hypothetical protein C6N75_00755 [Streptomyces solincola]
MAGYGTSGTHGHAHSGTNGLAIAGLVCGIIGIFLFNIILGPLAIIFGAVGLRQAKAGKGGAGMAKASIVLGIIDVVVFVVLMAVASSNGGFSWYVGG